MSETVYSYSRLTSFENCQYGYYLTYIKKFRSGETIYTFMGSKCHEILELLQSSQIDNSQAIDMFYEALEEADMIGLQWMSDNVRQNYVLSMVHFYDTYSRIDKKYDMEKYFEVEINGVKLKGYIDLTIFDDGYIDVYDYKTSTKFSSTSLPKYGRQLVLYAYALKQLNPEFEIRTIAWNMLKYGLIQGARKIKPELRCVIMEDSYIEPYILEWKYDEQTIQDLIEFVTSTVEKIESCLKEEDYQPCDLEKNSYSCKNICEHHTYCRHYQKFIKNKYKTS